MAPLPDVPSVLRLDYVHTYGADLNVRSRMFHRYTGAAPSAADCAGIAGNGSAQWVTNCVALANPVVSLTEVICTDLSSSTAGFGTSGTVHVGTRAGSDLSANDCALVAYTVDVRYRGGHPRGYWPFGSEPDLVSPSRWTVAFVDEFRNGVAGLADDMRGFISGGTTVGAQCAVSYYDGFVNATKPRSGKNYNYPALRLVPLVYTVSGWVGREKVGSQRRRLAA